MASRSWAESELGNLVLITTGRLDSNQSVPGGAYPFFTCSPRTLEIDWYAFDCEAVLLAGNNASGVFSVKFYSGKFNAYQRTYVIVSRDKGELDAKFLFYALQLSTKTLAVQSVGTATKFLTLPVLKRLSIPQPPLGHQKAIAKVLGALDGRIELNHRMNQTLEAMARAIFKAWFVEDEKGVEAKNFPIVDVYDIATVIYGAPFSSALFNEAGEGRPLIRIRDLMRQSPGIYTTEEHPKGRIVMPGEILVGMDGEFRARIWCGPHAWLNQRVCCFEPRPGVPRAFLLFSIEEPLAYFERSKTGTTVIHLGKADIDTFRFLLPPPEILRRFDELTSPMLEKIVANEAESRTLAALRDALLPKLLSGEIWVKQGERFVGEVV